MLRENFYYRTATLLGLAEQHGLEAQLVDDWHDPWDHQPKIRVTRRAVRDEPRQRSISPARL